MSDNHDNNARYDILFVDTDEKLEKLCASIKDAPFLVIDTEFIREKTYRANLCLIQIATDTLVACVDPLALPDLSSLMKIIYAEDKLKVLHAARQDYEIFHDMNNKLPQPVFDTQLAASLLGYGEQVGYASLVNKVLNVQLNKAHSRTDWSKRPLSQEQIQYASDDVYYLRKIFPLLQKQLIDLGRETWLESDFATLCQPETFITHPKDAWKRVKGVSRLRPRQLAAAKNLANWREQVAIERNKPRRWILADDLVIAIAQLSPTTMSQLSTIATLTKSTIDSSGKAILECVQAALKIDKADLPVTAKPARLSPDQEIIADILMAQLRLSANEQNISPTNIASRKDIEKIILGETDIPLLKSWRYKLAGEKIQNLLTGKYCLEIIKGKVRQKENTA